MIEKFRKKRKEKKRKEKKRKEKKKKTTFRLLPNKVNFAFLPNMSSISLTIDFSEFVQKDITTFIIPRPLSNSTLFGQLSLRWSQWR